jgi:hypothetical protein
MAAKKTYISASRHVEQLSSGAFVEPLGKTKDVDTDNIHDKTLIEDGTLIEVGGGEEKTEEGPKQSRGSATKKDEEDK